jgi:hypothetical protein
MKNLSKTLRKSLLQWKIGGSVCQDDNPLKDV